MRDRISAIIIDPNAPKAGYSDIEFKDTYDFCEKGFDIRTLSSANNILKELGRFRGCDVIVSIGKDTDTGPLAELSFDFRKKWVHFDEINKSELAGAIVNVFQGNINRPRPEGCETFSFFTCTYKTTVQQFNRLYNSIKAQTYRNWNWFIIDDSPNGQIANYITSLDDPRIYLFKTVSDHGNIGLNKHTIAMACDGEYIVEVDHDDELVPECLDELYNAFAQYPDAVFAYSDCMEEMDGIEVNYGEEWTEYRNEVIQGVKRRIPVTPKVSAWSIRQVYWQPNHVRCWKSSFYRQIGGHNIDLSVLDDMDLNLRTYLNGKMVKIPKTLYVQHQGQRQGNSRGTTEQGRRFKEVQRSNYLIYWVYDKAVHERAESLGAEDLPWNEENGWSDPWSERTCEPTFGYEATPLYPTETWESENKEPQP